MKKLFYLLSIAALLIIVTVSCEKDVTGISLNKSSLTLKIGETETLIATVQPGKATNKTVTWTSSNPLVATVMPNGLVTALSKGKTTVVATTADGSLSEMCEVIVEQVYVSGITLNKTSIYLEVGEKEQLIATVLPENASNKEVYWSSDYPSRVSVTQDGIITKHQKIGNPHDYTTITVSSIDNNYTAKCRVYDN
ncbi:MAG: Ig-like domain-containing protein [Bacteroidales bacterium]|jgi:uncharacterized protein YjdB|nr:Ig-like domain-containing protein [Bacteroidales bacterium]